MGFCDKCGKYRQLRLFSILFKGNTFRTSRCAECAREIEAATKQYDPSYGKIGEMFV